MKRIELYGPLEVLPVLLPSDEPGGEPVEGKQIVYTHAEGGEVMMYAMDSSMAKQIGTKLKMTNKQLGETLHEEAERAQARQRLAGGANGGVSQEQQQIANDILKGVHTRKEK